MYDPGDNCTPLWIACCCGCLPIVGLIKGLIWCGPVSIIGTLHNTLIALLHWPFHFFSITRALIKSRRIGPNLTFLSVLLAPIPLLIWPALCAIISFIAAFVWSFGIAFISVFDNRDNYRCYESCSLFSHCFTVFDDLFQYLKSFREWNSKSIFTYLNELRDYQLKPGENPIDIRLLEVPIALIIAAIGSIFVSTSTMIIGGIKLIPFLMKCYFELWKGYFKIHDCILAAVVFPFWIVANAILPAIVVLGYVACILWGLAQGPAAAIFSYSHGFAASFCFMLAQANRFDCKTTELVFGRRARNNGIFSCCFGGRDFLDELRIEKQRQKEQERARNLEEYDRRMEEQQAEMDRAIGRNDNDPGAREGAALQPVEHEGLDQPEDEEAKFQREIALAEQLSRQEFEAQQAAKDAAEQAAAAAAGEQNAPEVAIAVEAAQIEVRIDPSTPEIAEAAGEEKGGEIEGAPDSEPAPTVSPALNRQNSDQPGLEPGEAEAEPAPGGGSEGEAD